jgi:hypothetical protein
MHQLEQQLHHPPGEPNPVSMEARRAYLIEQMVEMMGRDGGHADAALAEEALKASNWNPEDAQVRNGGLEELRWEWQEVRRFAGTQDLHKGMGWLCKLMGTDEGRPERQHPLTRPTPSAVSADGSTLVSQLSQLF